MAATLSYPASSIASLQHRVSHAFARPALSVHTVCLSVCLVICQCILLLMHSCCVCTAYPFPLCITTQLHPCLLFWLCLLAVCVCVAVCCHCGFASLIHKAACPTAHMSCPMCPIKLVYLICSQQFCTAATPQDAEDFPRCCTAPSDAECDVC